MIGKKARKDRFLNPAATGLSSTDFQLLPLFGLLVIYWFDRKIQSKMTNCKKQP